MWPSLQADIQNAIALRLSRLRAALGIADDFGQPIDTLIYRLRSCQQSRCKRMVEVRHKPRAIFARLTNVAALFILSVLSNIWWRHSCRTAPETPTR